MMTLRQRIYHFLLHYGISTVLLIMLLAILYMMRVIGISNKVSVDIYADTSYGYCAYLPITSNLALTDGDTLTVSTGGGDTSIRFRIQGTTMEPSYLVCRMSPVSDEAEMQKAFGGNTRLTGYVFAEEIQLSHLIFRKWIRGGGNDKNDVNKQ